MGEVYRARDRELLRDVAVKFLPEAFTSNPRRLARFAQEARTASSLNHPNILTVHDVGQAEGVHFMVTELVEGSTLRRLLRTERRFSSRRALDMAIQIAEGLAKAHAAGIVHRDIKPENLMVTPEGLVKVLDFGLAKLHNPTSEDSDSEISDLPTWPGGQGAADLSMSDGSLVGTVGYVSPEQVLGRAVDHRSDQFALGATLYEMVTGRRAFGSETRGEALAAITGEQPRPIADLSPEFPAPAAWVVERCLAKDPADRYASTCDLAHALRGLREHLSELETGGVSITTAAWAGRGLRWLRNRLSPRPARVTAAIAAFAFLTMGLGRGDTARWALNLGAAPPRRAPVALLASGLSAPGGEGLSDDGARLEVMTFRWTRTADGGPADAPAVVVIEGRVERGLASVRITARLVDDGSSDDEPALTIPRRDLLEAAAVMAELLAGRGPGEGARVLPGRQ